MPLYLRASTNYMDNFFLTFMDNSEIANWKPLILSPQQCDLSHTSLSLYGETRGKARASHENVVPVNFILGIVANVIYAIIYMNFYLKLKFFM